MNTTKETRKEYFKNYYKEHKSDDCYQHTNTKYLKRKHELDNEQCELFKEDLKEFAALFTLMKKLKPKYKNEIINTFNNI